MKFLTLQINLSVCSIYTSFFLFNVTFFSPSFIPFSFLSSVHYITQVRSYFVLALCWQLFMLLFFVRSQENQTKQKGACEIWSSHKAADENSCLLLCYAMSLHGGVTTFSKESGAFSQDSSRLLVGNVQNHSPTTWNQIPPEFLRVHILLTTHQREFLLF
jgi:hypothetical protein